VTATARPDVVVRADAETGEGPVWDYRTGELVWVDIPRGILHRSTVRAATGATAGAATAAASATGSAVTGGSADRAVAVGMMLGAAVPDSAAGWAAAIEDGFGLIDAAGRLEVADRALPEPSTRMNDAACDSHGRMWAGSLGKTFDLGGGKLHRWTHGQPSLVAAEGLTLPNGIGWNAANTRMYLADTKQAAVFAYEFDLDDGRLGGRQAMIEVPPARGQPDGLCVDADGCIWLAQWGGWRVCRYDPGGRLLRTVDFPVAQPSSCAFGPDTTLYVTSAREGLPPDHDQPLAGSVFAFDAGVRGAPVGTFRL
jgi:sugar lactone lactonase YvrE